MPTESAFFFAGLLFVAAALGYVFARLGQLDDDDRGSAGLDYVRGLKFLLKEQPDRALEALTGAGELDEDTVETHFALGQMFRRRGEVERAIRVHRDLMDRPNLRRPEREKAQFALAEDYLSAGLFDRAESLLAELRDSPQHGIEALRRLVRLAELTREWERAAELRAELQQLDRSSSSEVISAHYACELAEQARQAKDPQRAAGWLERASRGAQDNIRVLLLRGALAADAGDYSQAIGFYERAAEREPSLLVDVLPRLFAASLAGGQAGAFSEFLERLLLKDPAAGRAIAFAAMINANMKDPVALRCLWEFVTQDPTLHMLVDVDSLRHASEADRQQALDRVRAALRSMATAGRVYRCLECGYSSISLQWQCPGCGAWDTVRPRVRLTFESSDR